MIVKNPDDSVQKEQFDASEEANEKGNEKNAKEVDNIAEKNKIDTSESESSETVDTAENPPEEKAEKVEKKPEPEKEEVEAEKKPEPKAEEVEAETVPAEVESSEEITGDDKDVLAEVPEDAAQVAEPAEELPDVDYSKKSRSDLVETLDLLVENRPPTEIKDDVENIKILFYKKYKIEVEEIKTAFLANGGAAEDFKHPVDELESIIKRILSRFRGKKAEFGKQFEIEKQGNLKRKYEIIELIKDLVNREESINKTFQEFRELQNEWYSLGAVPQSALKNLWETYNHNVELFYDYIKINKELRDLDFKKNLELKITLCEKAESLLNDQNPVGTFRLLQEYHQRWREIGPVPREERNMLWERFKEATSKINKRHHEYFEKQKDDQKKNLELKTELCEKIEALLEVKIDSFKDWENSAKDVIELQQGWRKIGFAPKKFNTSIYTRFREACDLFFQGKRNFYAANKEIQVKNLEEKIKLCVKAEEMQDSTDWKASTDEYIKLQKFWKEIGAVPRKNSDKVWKRFRKACDDFFNRKSEFFSEVDSSFENNLKLKEALILRLEEYKPVNKVDEAFEELKAIQEEWNSIGFVPFKKKDEIANKYRETLNNQFDKLKIDEDQKAIIKYQNKLDNLKVNPQASRKLRTERDKFMIRIKQLESDKILWENNIGFFSKSSNADSMIKEVESKIEDAKNTIEMLVEKVRMIDQSGLDE